MEIQVLYYIEYEVPMHIKFSDVEKYCDEHNITIERTHNTRIAKFYSSNEHNLLMLQYYNTLKNV